MRRRTIWEIVEPDNRARASEWVPRADDVLSVGVALFVIVTAGCGPHRAAIREPSFPSSQANAATPPPERRIYEEVSVQAQPSAEDRSPPWSTFA